MKNAVSAAKKLKDATLISELNSTIHKGGSGMD
jgi:hypothetical protein